MIDIKNLSKSFDHKPVLDHLNLTVKSGQTKVIIGRSGIGKSVLLKSIIGILKPESGSIKINNKEVTQLPERN